MKVSLVMAITADGKIAKNSYELVDWTSKEDKKFFIQKTKEARVLIIGKKTFTTIGRPLPNRLNIVLTRNPQNEISQEGLLEFTNQEPGKLLKSLANRGFKEIIVAGGAHTNSLFLEKNLIDEIFLTIEPKIFGLGLGIFSSPIEKNLSLLDVSKLSDNVILAHYKIIK
jgi:dihydrofolate reductase